MTEDDKQPATTEQNPAPAAPEPKARPAGYEPVDFDKLNLTPEQRQAIEPRIHYLYGNVQAGKRERDELRQWNERLQKQMDEQSERIAPLEKAQDDNRTAQLAAGLKAAREAGDTHTEALILKELAKSEAAAPPKQPTPKNGTPAGGFEPLRPAVEVWAQEIGDDGNLKRAWLAPDHPEHELAQGRLLSLTQEWERAGRAVTPDTLPVFLQQFEQKMGKANGRPASAAVLPSSQQRPPAKKGADLSIEEKHHADKFMPHIKDPDERYRRYAAQKEQMRPRPR